LFEIVQRRALRRCGVATNAFDVRKGLDVFSSDGQKLGTVESIFSGKATAVDTGDGRFTDMQAAPAGPTPIDPDPTVASSDDDAGSVASGPEARLPVTQGLGTFNTGTETTGFAGGAQPAGAAVGPATEGMGGSVTLTPSDTKYIAVKHGGFLGFGGDSLYIPFSAVEDAAPGGSITLNCTADDCGRLYNQKPEALTPENEETSS
jgi:hypothetical protein